LDLFSNSPFSEADRRLGGSKPPAKEPHIVPFDAAPLDAVLGRRPGVTGIAFAVGAGAGRCRPYQNPVGGAQRQPRAAVPGAMSRLRPATIKPL